MSELEEESSPFLCLEVDGSETLNNLASKLDHLFPNRIIRFVINKEYSSIFYLGENKFYYKPKKRKKTHLECKVMTKEDPFDFFDIEHLAIFNDLNLKINNFKVTRDINVSGNYYPGLIFTDGVHYIIDQYLFSDTNDFYELFSKFFPNELIMDTTNKENTGLLIFKTKENILGVNKTNDSCDS